jgi:hypothetical protein
MTALIAMFSLFTLAFFVLIGYITYSEFIRRRRLSPAERAKEDREASEFGMEI